MVRRLNSAGLCGRLGLGSGGWEVLLWLLVLLSLLAVRGEGQTEVALDEATVRSDAQGNLYVTSGAERRVFVDGLDVTALATTLAAQQAELDRLQVQRAELYRAVSSLLRSSHVLLLGGRMESVAGFNATLVFDGTSWSRGPSMPTARYTPGAAVYRNEVYVAGGYDNANLAATDIFDGVAWRTGPLLSTARHRLALAVYQDRLYAFGGRADLSVVSTMEVYDDDMELWVTTATPMPTARHSQAVCVFDGLLFAIGGKGQPRATLTTVEAFDGRTWLTMPSLLQARQWATAAAYADKLWVMGGYDGARNLVSVEAFTTATGWVAQSPLYVSSLSVSAVVFNHRLLLFGDDVIQVLNGSTWTVLGDMPEPWTDYGLVVFP
ncbi:uncharacterized protein MONBRDRAFT_10500 [Monosiga brevicollis MX1]|uniref:Uncharacterized protein n=1 Tax=Monosiga brevicollis TaxID=81824 RepID=A9V6E1_MONBE|nr:uncharacterized protein MONBRDRAFT_10500 [Monosiga brevicollis MX1]EDQ87050.1 predicted protein [Monosiga brevicollis MX1]|eukprot:XP_001748289.1 hypothetical protein [Monosiga brevicollis MX1]